MEISKVSITKVSSVDAFSSSDTEPVLDGHFTRHLKRTV